MGSNIKDLEKKLDVLESELQKGHYMEVEEEYLIMKDELECWENVKKKFLLNSLRRSG